MALLIDDKVAASLSPIATVDLGAWVKTETLTMRKLKDLLKQEGLVLDELSNEIWLPEEYECEDFFIGNYVKCKKVKPIYLLVSKAIKAPEKNKQLIADALVEYGQELVDLIEKYDGDINQFL